MSVMVKGVTKNVIVVKSPDPKLFEQALFILREDAPTGDGVSAEDVLAQARQVADGYVRRNSRMGRWFSRYGIPLGFAGGAACASLIWFLTVFGV